MVRDGGDYSLVLRLLVLQPFSPTASSPTSSSPTHFSFFHSTVLQPNSPMPTGPTSCYHPGLLGPFSFSSYHEKSYFLLIFWKKSENLNRGTQIVNTHRLVDETR